MLNAYLLDNTPGVVLADDVSAMKIVVLRRLTVAEPSTSGRALVIWLNILSLVLNTRG